MQPLTLDRSRELAFYQPPVQALGQLRLLTPARGTAEAAEVSWLIATVLGGLGSFADAVAVLAPLLAGEPPTPPVVTALACETMASLLRQVGRHMQAEAHDERGLRLANAAPLPGALEAVLDCQVGLVADAVGQADVPTARRRLDVARATAEGLGSALWRPRLRVQWVTAEVALLVGAADAAVAAGAAAVGAAEAARAPRHLAKGLLFLGVASLAAGDRDNGVAHLERAAALAGDVGALPLVWPANAVLARVLQPDAAAPERHRVAAARAVRELANRLPPGWRDAWLASPDVAWLVGHS